MAIAMPDLTVEVYNADYRVLSRIPWQGAVLLMLRGAVYVVDVYVPAVHVHGPSLVIELPVSVALREYVYVPSNAANRVTREGVLRRDRHICGYCMFSELLRASSQVNSGITEVLLMTFTPRGATQFRSAAA